MVAELETIKQEQVDCLVGDYIGFGASYAERHSFRDSVCIVGSDTQCRCSACVPLLPLPPAIVHAALISSSRYVAFANR